MLGIKRYAASKETCIAMSDYDRMHTHRSCRPLPVPRWTLSDEKVRKVVAHRICITAGEQNVPTNLQSLRQLEKKYYVVISRQKQLEILKHLQVVRTHGGPVAYHTSLIYRRFRLNMNSPELAAHYGLQPTAMRQSINRLCRIARALFPDPKEHLAWQHNATIRELPSPVPRNHMYVGCRTARKYKNLSWNPARIAYLYRHGKDVSAIARACGYPHGAGKNRVRNVLLRAGIYQKAGSN
jgi:hypothetical protein